jgi:CNT family concentrative nucleoside transporter
MILQNIVGFTLILSLAWLLSENRKSIGGKYLLLGLGCQCLLATLLLKAPGVQGFFLALNRVVLSLEESMLAGTSLVFGYVGGGSAPFETVYPEATFVMAFQALPLVLLVSALSSLLFYWGVLPLIVKGFSWFLQRSLHLGGAEGLGVATNIFLGMVESPLLVRPYLQSMTRSELFTVMTAGMATIAGTVMILYASILSDAVPGIMGHILVASIINAPAAVVISKIMIPETGKLTSGELTAPEPAFNSMDAITKGTLQGVQLVLNIAAMLVVLIALVHLANLTLSLLPPMGSDPITLQRVLGYVMAPLVWLMGIPWEEAVTAGRLMGTKTILNELIAYLDLSQLPADALSEKSRTIITYAMCGFANPGSLGIMIGGMGTMAPDRRGEIVSLGFRSVLAGTLATCLTGTLVGILL